MFEDEQENVQHVLIYLVETVLPLVRASEQFVLVVQSHVLQTVNFLIVLRLELHLDFFEPLEQALDELLRVLRALAEEVGGLMVLERERLQQAESVTELSFRKHEFKDGVEARLESQVECQRRLLGLGRKRRGVAHDLADVLLQVSGAEFHQHESP